MFAGVVLTVELATTPDEQERGLSGRDSMPVDHGMLFIYKQVQSQWGFWMHEMNFPLDIIWFNANREAVYIIQNLQPCPPQFCQVLTASVNAMYVLDLNAGFVHKYGVTIGESFTFQTETSTSAHLLTSAGNELRVDLSSRTTDGLLNQGRIRINTGTGGQFIDYLLPNYFFTQKTQYTAIALPPTGYEFLGWSVQGNVRTDTNAPTTVIYVDGTGLLEVVFKPETSIAQESSISTALPNSTRTEQPTSRFPVDLATVIPLLLVAVFVLVPTYAIMSTKRRGKKPS